jgi:hypothetical protein
MCAAISEVSAYIQERLRKLVGISSAELNGMTSTDLDDIITRLKPGPARAKYKVGGYYGVEGPISTLLMTDDTMALAPLVIEKFVVVEEVGVDVTTTGSGGSLYTAIYNDRGDCYPGALIHKSAALAVTAAFQSTTGLTLKLPPGLYWVGTHNSGAVVTPVTVRCVATSFRCMPLAAGADDTDAAAFTQAVTADSVPPDTFTSTVTVAGKAPRVVLKIKQA